LGRGRWKRAGVSQYLAGGLLHKNLGEAVEAFLIRARIRLPEMKSQEPTPVHPLTTYSATPAQQGRTQARLLRKWKLYQRIHELHEEGMSLRKIGEELGLARGTVRKYFRQPTRAASAYASSLAGKQARSL
jgi:DNA-binding NarL/FixJ family response regulator